MDGRCALCHGVKKLCESHIIPKFMTKNIRKSPSRVYILEGETILRCQDTQKNYMLCQDCEEKFSKLERHFSNNYLPRIQEPLIDYDQNLYPFIISIFWRILEFESRRDNHKIDSPYTNMKFLKDYLHSFLNSNKIINNPVVFMFTLDNDKIFDIDLLAGRKKIGNITYSSYAKFTNASPCDKINPPEYAKDSATNYTVRTNLNHSLAECPFIYYNIFQKSTYKLFFLVIEKFIFCLDLGGSASEFPVASKIAPQGGKWENLQFPQLINDFLNEYGESINHDLECSDEEIREIQNHLWKNAL